MLNPGSTYSEEFPAVAESVPEAREAVTGFARAAGAGGERLDAIRLAASEGVTNAVLHAYQDGSGSFQVSATYVEGELWLLISDDGAGLRRGSVRSGLGVGLVLIAELADDFEIVHRSNGGTELRLRFKLHARGRDFETQPRGRRSEAASPA
ncbi:MAG: ATP-binding protein [Solirubrobacteraceae bacterium]